MKTSIETQIQITATPEKIWELLISTALYANWNPFILSIDGKIAKNEAIVVRIAPPEGKAMTFRPIVLVAKKNKEIRWLGKLGIKGLFDGEHQFLIEQIDENTCIFKHNEHFSGLLVPLFTKMLSKTKRGFEEMNKALKTEAEK